MPWFDALRGDGYNVRELLEQWCKVKRRDMSGINSRKEGNIIARSLDTRNAGSCNEAGADDVVEREGTVVREGTTWQPHHTSLTQSRRCRVYARKKW